MLGQNQTILAVKLNFFVAGNETLLGSNPKSVLKLISYLFSRSTPRWTTRPSTWPSPEGPGSRTTPSQPGSGGSSETRLRRRTSSWRAASCGGEKTSSWVATTWWVAAYTPCFNYHLPVSLSMSLVLACHRDLYAACWDYSPTVNELKSHSEPFPSSCLSYIIGCIIFKASLRPRPCY